MAFKSPPLWLSLYPDRRREEYVNSIAPVIDRHVLAVLVLRDTDFMCKIKTLWQHQVRFVVPFWDENLNHPHRSSLAVEESKHDQLLFSRREREKHDLTKDSGRCDSESCSSPTK